MKLEKTMTDLENLDIDYEHMDDLPLLDRIEWNHAEPEEIIPETTNQLTQNSIQLIMKSLQFNKSMTAHSG